MRKYDIAYVPSGPVKYEPPKAVDDMSLDEIKRKYIKTCGKANGNISVCSKCTNPCEEGKRAIQLLANQIYNNPPIPLYGGKTLIEKAREENMERRKKMEENAEFVKAVETAQNKPTKKRGYIKWDGWWEESLASGDQVKWLMDNMKISKSKAKHKIYQYKWSHNMVGSGAEKEQVTPKEEPKEEIKQETKTDSSIESKLESLMQEQEEYKKQMSQYMNLYNNAKEKYEELKKMTDVLCSAMDILNN